MTRMRALLVYPESRRGAGQNINLVDSRKHPGERKMILLATKVLIVWTVTALAVGFGLGAMIRTADRVRKEETLKALLSTLDSKQVAH